MPDEKMIMLGNFIPPQFKNAQGKWELVRGHEGAYLVMTPVEVEEEPFGGSGNMTKEFTTTMTGIVISNDSEPDKPGAADLTFTIDGKTRVVKAGEVYKGSFKPFTIITINSTVPWRAEGLQTIGGFSVPTDTTAPENVTNLTVSSLATTSLTLTWVASTSDDCVGYDIYRGSTLIGSVTETTFNVTGLTQNTQYTFSVRAKDAANNVATGNTSGSSTTITTPAAADTTAPANVTNPTTTNLTQSGVTLNWDPSASSDVASYDVYNGTTFLGNTTSVTYNVTGLSASTAYTLYVKAKDSSGNVASGTQFNVTTSAQPADSTPPADVTVTTSNLTSTGVTLTWPASSSSDIKDYRIYQGSTLITTVTGLSYNVTGLSPSTAYTFTVKARDTSNNEASGIPVDVTTSAAADTTPPTVSASPVAGTYTSTQSVTLTGSDNSGGAVTIYYTTDGSTPTQSSTVYSAAISIPATATIKFFGKDPSGNVSAVQTATYTINTADTTAPNPVTGLTAGTPASNSVPLSWTLSSSGDVSTQEVAYSTDGTNFTVASSAVNSSSNSYTVTGLIASTAYTFRVVAIDAANNRSTATTTTATTAAPNNITTNLKGTYAADFTKPGGVNTNLSVVVPAAVMNEAAYTKVAYAYTGAIPETGNANLFSSSNSVFWVVDKVVNGGQGSSQYTTANTAFTVQQNTWYHIVQVFDGTLLKIYVDGVQKYSGAPQSTTISNQTDVRIGSYTGLYPWSGYIAGAWIYGRALTPQEITDHAAGTIASSGLLGEWKFEEGTGTTANDTSGNNNHGTMGSDMLWKNVSAI